MQKNDFEQKYYDLLYENKKIKKENEQLKQEIEIYKNFINKKPLKKQLIEFVITKNNQKEKL